MTILSTLMDMGIYVLPFLGGITAIVFFHELGHYLLARRNGIKVDIFSIGFGPEIFGWNDKKGTRWRFAWIPLGGYVKMAGDAGAASQADHYQLASASAEERAFFMHTKKPFQKMVVAFGGPLANMVLTYLLFVVVIIFFGKKEPEPVIGSFVPGGVAEKLGFQAGDHIQSIEVIESGVLHDIDHYRVLQKIVQKNPGKLLRFKLLRQGEEVVIEGKPDDTSEDQLNLSVGRLGIYPVVKKYGVWDSFGQALGVTRDLSWRILSGIGSLITGKEDSSQLGGMFLMAKSAHDFAAQGLSFFLEFLAVLSLNLGIINLIPIPALDGGHILFYALEFLRGKPLSERAQDFFYKIGLFLLISLMVFSHWNDIVRYSFFDKLKAFF